MLAHVIVLFSPFPAALVAAQNPVGRVWSEVLAAHDTYLVGEVGGQSLAPVFMDMLETATRLLGMVLRETMSTNPFHAAAVALAEPPHLVPAAGHRS